MKQEVWSQGRRTLVIKHYSYLLQFYTRIFLLSEQFSWEDQIMFYHLTRESPIKFDVNRSVSILVYLVQSLPSFLLLHGPTGLQWGRRGGSKEWQGRMTAGLDRLQTVPATPILPGWEPRDGELQTLYITNTNTDLCQVTPSWLLADVPHMIIIIIKSSWDVCVLFPVCPHQLP